MSNYSKWRRFQATGFFELVFYATFNVTGRGWSQFDSTRIAQCNLKILSAIIFARGKTSCRINHLMGLAQGKFNGPLELTKVGRSCFPRTASYCGTLCAFRTLINAAFNNKKYYINSFSQSSHNFSSPYIGI